MRALTAPLFVPANRPDRFGKAALSGADAVIIDLEDAVPPALKDEARSNLAAAATLSVPPVIRINADGTPWLQADLDAVAQLGFRMVCVPKVEAPDLLDRLLSELGSGAEIVAQIETARGVENAAAIAGHPSVRQLAFGPADFFLDMAMPASREMTGHVLRRLAVVSRATGIEKPLDGPCFAVGDAGALLRECAEAIASGAGGKLCIHPSQPEKVLERFLPGPDEVAWARRVVAADRDGGAQLVDGRMIDAPLAAHARAVLERVEAQPLATALPGQGRKTDP